VEPPASDDDRALLVLRDGGLVGMPTETVYGLAADASNERAVRRVFTAKGRPAEHPLIVHVATADAAHTWSSGMPEAATVIAAACWPGPLTLLVPRAGHVLDVVTGGRESVGVRVPAHAKALLLLARFGGGVVAPSANRFGRVSPTTAQHVRDDLGDLVDFVLDGGPCAVGVESTIVDCCVDPPQLLRPGGIPAEHISSLLNGELAASRGPSRAAGMLPAHYQPDCAVVLAESAAEAAELAAANPNSIVLDHTDDLLRYARTLYQALRDADRRHVDVVVAVLPSAAGLGYALRDRLAKAAHRA
jgi:L-threonylcarbamoyladenylate synthase